MKKGTFKIARLGLIAASALGLAGCPDGGGTTNDSVFKDEFSSSTLNSGWTVENSNPANLSLTANSGFLRIITEQGSFDETDSVKNVLLHEVSGDFTATARVFFTPEADRQLAGVVIRGDEFDMLFALTQAITDSGTYQFVLALAEQPEGLEPSRQARLYAFDDVYLRVVRQGGNLTVSTSRTGDVFSDIGTVSMTLPDSVRVGIFAGTGTDCTSNCAAATPADFDEFEITAP